MKTWSTSFVAHLIATALFLASCQTVQGNEGGDQMSTHVTATFSAGQTATASIHQAIGDILTASAVASSPTSTTTLTLVPPTKTHTVMPTPTELPPTGTAVATATVSPTSPNPPATPRPTSPPPSATAAPAAQLPPVEVRAYCALFGQSPAHVADGQSVIIWWGWKAATEAYRQDYIDSASFTVQIDRQFVDVSSAVQTQSTESDGYAVRWRLPPRVFPNGSHQVVFTSTLSQRITDGYDSNQDGVPDTYNDPGTYPYTCEIISE